LGLLESAVLGIITAGSSARGPNANPSLQGNSAARTSYAVNDSNSHQYQQQQQLIQTARQLSAINPSLAATVAEYAMSLEAQQPQYSQQDPVSNTDGRNGSNRLSTYTNTSAQSNQNECTIQKDPGSSNASSLNRGENISVPAQATLPQKPVSLLTLQGWSLEQLGKFGSNMFKYTPRMLLIFAPLNYSESYKKQLQKIKQPVPRAVDIVIEDIKRKKEKHEAKLAANRRSASSSRARKLKVSLVEWRT
jgi:hypothetical protein